MTARSRAPEILQGTLEVMVLRVLEGGPAHGYAVARCIERAADGDLVIEEGSLYPALHRLLRRGDVSAEWTVTEQNRRARVYKLTARGRGRLAEQMTTWARVSAAVTRVLARGAERPA